MQACQARSSSAAALSLHIALCLGILSAPLLLGAYLYGHRWHYDVAGDRLYRAQRFTGHTDILDWQTGRWLPWDAQADALPGTHAAALLAQEGPSGSAIGSAPRKATLHP